MSLLTVACGVPSKNLHSARSFVARMNLFLEPFLAISVFLGAIYFFSWFALNMFELYESRLSRNLGRWSRCDDGSAELLVEPMSPSPQRRKWTRPFPAWRARSDGRDTLPIWSLNLVCRWRHDDEVLTRTIEIWIHLIFVGCTVWNRRLMVEKLKWRRLHPRERKQHRRRRVKEKEKAKERAKGKERGKAAVVEDEAEYKTVHNVKQKWCGLSPLERCVCRIKLKEKLSSIRINAVTFEPESAQNWCSVEWMNIATCLALLNVLEKINEKGKRLCRAARVKYL